MGLLITTEDALSANAQEVVSSKRKIIEKAIDDLLKLPIGSSRWKGAVQLYLTLNLSSTPGMTAQEEYALTVQENARLRDNQATKFGTSTDKAEENMRYQLQMPAGAHRLIQLVDPTAFSKENIGKLRRALPELCVAERY